MEPSLKIIPYDDNLRKITRIPFCFYVTPAKEHISTKISCRQEDLIRCVTCQAYLCKNCSKNEKSWFCSICGTKNSIKINDFAQAQYEFDNFHVILQTIDDFSELIVFYISSQYRKDEFLHVKSFIKGVTNGMGTNSKCLVFYGSDSSQYAILAPPEAESRIEISHKLIINSGLENLSELEYSHELEPYHAKTKVVRFRTIEEFIGIDLSKFLFGKETIYMLNNALDEFSFGTDSLNVLRAIELTGTLSKVMDGIPVRMLCFVPELYKYPSIIEALRPFPCRFDIIVNRLNENAFDLLYTLQGSIVHLINDDSQSQGIHLIRQKTKYQIITRCRAKNCSISWRDTLRPLQEIENQVLFAPVAPTDSQPYVMDFNPLPKQNEISFQVTSKYIKCTNKGTKYVFRVINYKLKSSLDLENIAKSINWSIVVSSWLRSVAVKPKRDAVETISKAIATVIHSMGRSNCEELESMIPSLSSYNLFSKDTIDRHYSTEVLFKSLPSEMYFQPRTIYYDNEYLIISINGISISSNQILNQARSLQYLCSIYAPITIKNEEKSNTADTPLMKKLIIQYS